MLIKIALNGARPKSDNVFVPHSLSEITEEVKSVFKLGYDVFHIHCYDENGIESLQPEDVSKLVTAVKNISPGIQIGISTGDWIVPDLNERINLIRNWTVCPDFASVNMIEDDALEVSRALIEKGVMIEAGINEKKAAEVFINSGMEKNTIRLLIEPEPENLKDALVTVSEIEKVLDESKPMVKRLLHGFNSAAWDLLREAKRRGYDGRIGMEDVIYLEDGTLVKSNAEIIKFAEGII